MKVLIFIVFAGIVMIQAIKPEYIADVPNVSNSYSELISGRTDILDSAQQLIYDLLQNAIDLLNTLRASLHKILESAINLLTGLVNDAEKLLSSLVNDVLQQIQEVAEIHLPCVADQEKNVQNILAAGRTDIHACINTAFLALDDVRNHTAAFETDIVNEISKIRQLLSQCFSINPIELVQCVIGSVKEIGESLSEIAFYAKQAIKLAATDIDEIVKDTRTCVDTVIKGVQNQLDTIKNDIINCIESQKSN